MGLLTTCEVMSKEIFNKKYNDNENNAEILEKSN